MPKRFTDTEKWKDEWYASLSNDYKIVWQWLLDNCDHAGILKRGVTLLNQGCKTTLSEKDLSEIFEGRVMFFERFYFIPKFVKFQYLTLTTEKPAIVSVRKLLKDKGLDRLVNELFGNDYITIEQSLSNHSAIIKDKDKDKDKDMDKGVIKGENKNGILVHLKELKDTLNQKK